MFQRHLDYCWRLLARQPRTKPAKCALNININQEAPGSQPHTRPSDVNAQERDVIVDGLGNLAVTRTPEAAAETADRLIQGAATANGQRLTLTG